MYNLFLDDERGLHDVANFILPYQMKAKYRLEQWVIVRNYLEFTKYITDNGLPSKISFDHDLGDHVFHRNFVNGKMNYDSKDFKKPLQKTGYHCAKWLIDYCLDNDVKLPEVFVHSLNPVGADNIRALLQNFKDKNT